MRLTAPVVAMGHAHTQGGKPRAHPAACSFAPTHRTQVGRAQAHGKFFGRKRLMLLIPAQSPWRTAHFALGLGRKRHDLRWPYRDRKLDTNRVGKFQSTTTVWPPEMSLP